MADLLGTDEFLVNRNDVTYIQQQETLMANLESTDHLLINRAGQTYKITGEDLVNSIVDPLSLTVTLAPINPVVDQEIIAIPTVSGGKQPDGGYVFTYQWMEADDINGLNKTNIVGANTATYTPTDAQVSKYIGCVSTTTDALGTNAEGETFIGPVGVIETPPVIATVKLSEIENNGKRYTDKEFPFVTTMAIEGEPAPEFAVKAKLSGTTFDFTVQSDAITAVEGAGSHTCETDLIESVDTTLYWNQAQNWSNSLSVVDGSFHSSGSASKAFNGDMDDNASSSGNKTLRFTCPVAFPAGVKLEVQTNTSASGDHTISVNGGDGISYAGTGDFHEIPYEAGDEAAFVIDLLNDNIDAGTDLTGIRIGGQLLVDTTVTGPGPQGNTTLTLSGTKDLDCFEAGDAVQTVLTGEWVSGNFLTGYEGSKAFDGIALAGNNTCAVPTADDLPETCRWEGSIKIPTGATVTASVWRQTDSGYLKVNDVDVTPAATGITINLTTIDISTAAGSEITSLEINRTIANNGGIGFAAIYINGVAVTSDSVVKVVSKDPDATPPTITVDGGDWQGTDDVPADQNRDQVWSDNVTATASYKTGWENTKIFDGNTSTGCTTGDPGNVNRITITFPEGIDYLTSIHTSRTDGPTTSGAVYCAVNDEPDNSSTEVPHNPDGNIKTEIRSGSGTLNKLEFFNNGPSNPAVNNIWIDGKLLVDPAGDTTVKGKTTSWDTTLTLAGPASLDVLKVSDTVKMGDAADVPYQPVSDSITNVNTVAQDFDGLITSWTLTDIKNAAHYPATTGPFSPNDNSFAYFYDGNAVPIDNRATATAYTDLLTIPSGSAIEIAWQGDSDTNYSSTILQLLDADGNVVLETPFNNPGNSTTTANKVAVGTISSPVTRLLVRIDTAKDVAPKEYLGGFAGIWVDGKKIVPGTYSQTTLTLSDDTDLAYFRNGDVVQGTVLPSTNYSQYCDRFNIEPTHVDKAFDGVVSASNPNNYFAGTPGASSFVSAKIEIPDLPPNAPVKVYGKFSNGGSGNSALPVSDLYYKFNDEAAFQPTPEADFSVEMNTVVKPDGTLTVELTTNNGGGPVGWNYATVSGIEVNGIILINNTEQEGPKAKITSIDANHPSITVDGGSWYADPTNSGDGSGDADGDTEVTCLSPLKAPTNWTVEDIDTDNNQLMLSHTTPDDNAQVWVANDNQAGTDFYVEPKDAVVDTTDVAYGNLSVVNNQALVTSIQKSDPGYLPIASKDYTIKFPTIFPTGNAPDADLPVGCDLTVRVKAENALGFSEKDSNTVLPEAGSPDGLAGPITASTPTTLTVATSSNLDTFSTGDNLVMVDENSDISDYTIVSDSIVTVGESPVIVWSQTDTVGKNGQGMTYTNDNDTISNSSTNQCVCRATDFVTDGKFYFEYVIDSLTGGIDIAFMDADVPLSDTGDLYLQLGVDGVRCTNNGNVFVFGGDTGTTVSLKYQTGSIVRYAIDTIDGNVDIAVDGGDFVRFTNARLQGLKAIPTVYIRAGGTLTGIFDGDTNYDPPEGYQVMSGFPLLTLSGDTDLAYFRKGDEVQKSTAGVDQYASNFFLANAAPNADNVPIKTSTLITNAANAFDGNTGTAALNVASPGQGLWLTIPTPFKASEISLWSGTGGTQYRMKAVVYDDEGNQATELWSNLATSRQWFTVDTSALTGNITDVVWWMPNNKITPYAYKATIDGTETDLIDGVPTGAKILDIDPNVPSITVDGGDWDPAGVTGDAEVTYGPVTGTGVFQSADLDANTMTLSVSNDRWIDNNNRLSKDFYVRDSITVLNADNPKHVAMQQAIADAFAAFPVKANQRRTSIASSLYRLMAGETLSAAEFELLEDTVTNAVNAQEPFALDGYYPLYYTSEKADAASSVNTHHTHTINGVEYYMPDGGTLYHGTYVLPE